MNFIVRKSISLYNRIKTGFQFMLFPQKYYLYEKYLYGYHSPFFSQEGEDAILARFFDDQKMGYYIDVGAHHPQRFSNTYHFYLKGWQGINIDAMPGSMILFRQLRSRDINLEMAISDSHKTLAYYQFNEPALNGFSKDLSMQRDGKHHYKVISQIDLPTFTLSEILDKHMPSGQEIDFLSIDVEGFDLNVLKSNDWQKYRPQLILVESLGSLSLNAIEKSPIAIFLNNQNYTFYAKTVNTLFFRSCLKSPSGVIAQNSTLPEVQKLSEKSAS